MQPLNEEQRQAVLFSGGPLLILAGAGTGKTRVIASRIVSLLRRDPSLSPENLLALTFSRKAAEEMRERMRTLMGSPSDGMSLFTFHGFCRRFLEEHALELGLPARLRLLDRAEAWVFFRRLLPEMKVKSYASLSDPAGCVDGFLRCIGRAKDEMVSPEEYAVHARSLQEAEERKQGLEVARVYGIYQRRMRETGAFDFGDLVVETVCALRARPGLLKRLRARYRALLVDEFQDTNVAQIELLKLLAGPQGDLCVVGDDDQAIYRFRGASFASFLLMKEAFPSVQTLRLTRNYRSTPTILGAAERLIRHNEPDRYDPEKKLWTSNPDEGPVEVWICRDEAHEAEVVARRIRELYGAQPDGQRRWDRIAVLYRAHAHRKRLEEALRRSGIPFSVRGGASLFEQPAVRDLRALLAVLWNPDDSVSFFRLLSHPLWAVPAEELMAVARLARDAEKPILSILESGEGIPSSGLLREAARRLLAELKEMRRKALRLGVEELIPYAAEKSFLRALFRLPAGPGSNPALALAHLLRLSYRYAQSTPEANDLGSFLWYLDCLERASSDDFSDEEEAQESDGVRLMTVHQAKGLEFDWVVLLEMVGGRFPARSRPDPIPFPVELMKEPLPRGDYHLQEERRLCYVACTRARRGLLLVSQDRERYRPSPFLQEMTESEWGEGVVRSSPEAATQAAPAAISKWPAGVDPVSMEKERRLLELLALARTLNPADRAGFDRVMLQVLELVSSAFGSGAEELSPSRSAPLPVGTKLSFSQLEAYRYCPLKYLYAYIYRIPVRATPQMLFGIDLHASLEGFYREVMEGRIPSEQELEERFRKMHVPGRYGEPAQDREYRRLGLEILRKFHRKQKGSFPPPLFVEKSFALPVGEVVLHGVVDRADPLEGGGIEILDYKSGKPKEGATAEEQLQLRLYALAAREVFHLEPRKVSFYYLRENRLLSFEQKPSDIEETRTRILERVAQVRSGDFTPTPSAVKCRRCDFSSLCPASLA